MDQPVYPIIVSSSVFIAIGRVSLFITSVLISVERVLHNVCINRVVAVILGLHVADSERTIVSVVEKELLSVQAGSEDG